LAEAWSNRRALYTSLRARLRRGASTEDAPNPHRDC
jgi:hypothetical protein